MTSKIIVRSYGRPQLIRQLTLATLEAQEDLDLNERLFIVVHKDQVGEYEESLKDFPKAGFIVKTEKGGHKSIEAAHHYFPDGEPLLFLDDDIPPITHYTSSPSKESAEELACLGRYMDDAFATLEEIGAASWTVKWMSNLMWMSGLPWKQFRPHHMAGNFWGAFNSPLIVTELAHEDDRVRGARFIEHFGGSLVYNWFTSKGNDDFHPGGMAATGERGDADALERTRKACEYLWENEEPYRKYHLPPAPSKSWGGYYTVRLKNINQIRKLRPFHLQSWTEPFQVRPDVPGEEKEDVVFDTLFGDNT